MKDTGIVLISLGKRGYGFAAFNLALSLKHYSPEIPIHLIHDGRSISQLDTLTYFDSLQRIEQEDYLTKGQLDPGKAKARIYKYLPFKHNLYLDVDALAFKDITPFIEEKIALDKYYLTDVLGVSAKDKPRNYSIWANDTDIWNFFGLDDAQQFPAIQSSWAYIKKGREAKKLFNLVSKNYDRGFPVDRLSIDWGKTIPDELIFGGSLAQLNYIPPRLPEPIFRGWKFDDRSPSELAEAYYFLSIYGNGTGRSLTKLKYWKLYDKRLEILNKEYGRQHQYKGAYIKADKHANG